MLLVLLACLMPFYVLGGCYPNLTFNWEALRHEPCTYRGDFGDAVVDSIMRNHSGIGVKILKLGPSFIPYHNNLNSWLQVAVKPGMKNSPLGYGLHSGKNTSFPCRFYRMGLGTHFGILNLAVVPSTPHPNLAPYEA